MRTRNFQSPHDKMSVAKLGSKAILSNKMAMLFVLNHLIRQNIPI